MNDQSDKIKVLLIERKFQGFFSLEKVFRQVAKKLSSEKFDTAFQQVPFGSSITGIVRNLFSFKPQAADILHLTGDITYLALVLPPSRTVVTIHDLSILRYRTGLRRWVLKKLLFDLPVRRSHFITVISAATKNELISQTGCSPEKITLIENPVDDSFRGSNKPPFNPDCPNILQVGTLPYKNVPNLIRAIEGLKCKLTLIGEPDIGTQRLLEEKKIDYHTESMLDDDGMREQYRRADLVTFCSVFEGFGLPIIEAQAMQTPLITSNIDPMKSVAGEGALLVDPREPSEIRSAIESIIHDEGLRTKLIERGRKNVERFEPSAVADRYAELYSRVVNARK